MASIQELVRALRARPGVDAAVLLGRDGLIIDAQTDAGLDGERLAALVPLVVGAAEELSTQAARGPLTTAVLEFSQGVAIISLLGSDTMLLVLATAEETGPLLYELRRNRGRLATLV